MKKCFFILSLIVILVSACAGGTEQKGIQIKEPWARAASAMQGHGSSAETGAEAGSSGMSANGAAYMVIENHGANADNLLGVSSDVAEFVEVHKTEMQDGIMSMKPVASIEIPAKGEVELKPGGFHVMLIGLKKDLIAGEKISLVLKFEQAGNVRVEAEIRAP